MRAGGSAGLRYLEWVWDPAPRDAEYVADYVYLLRERDGSVRVVHDRHHEGLFPRELWLSLLTEQGFDAQSVPLVHSDVELGRHEMFVGCPQLNDVAGPSAGNHDSHPQHQ